MTLAVFGGAFDPPHLGHVAVVQHAIARFDPERLLVVPAGDPPHKSVATPAATRFRLAELAFARIPRVEVSDLELLDGGPRYTVDTLRALKRRAPDLTLVLGADQLAAFSEWREPDAILELARLVVASRPGIDERSLDAAVAAISRPERIECFGIPAYEISSSEIRRRAAEGESLARFVPVMVAAQIERQQLYR